MMAANQDHKQAANPPTGRKAAETVKSAAESAKSMGEQISDVAERFSDAAAKQYGHAQDMAVDALDSAHTVMRRNPLTAVMIALGIGFLLGALTSARR